MPDFEYLITPQEVLGGSLDAVSKQPVINCQQSGVVGWIIEPSSQAVVFKDRIKEINIYQVPVAVAVLAWLKGWIDIYHLADALARNKQILKPGDEGIVKTSAGYQGFCWCGYKQESVSEAASLRLLTQHIENHFPT